MKIKNVSGDDRLVPALGGRLVMAGAEVPIDGAELAWGFLQQETNWAPADDEARNVVKDHEPSEPEADAPAEVDNTTQTEG